MEPLDCPKKIESHLENACSEPGALLSRMTPRRRSILAIAAIVGLSVLETSALAFDVEPGNYIYFPSGTNLLFGYYQYASSDKFIADNGSRVPNSELTSDVGILRENYYGDLDGTPFCTHVILPFGTIESVRVGGVPLTTDNGLGDLIVGATIWPIHTTGDYGTDFGVSQFLVLPTGTFNPNGAGLGSGAISANPELGIVQHLGHGFMLSSTLDARFQADRNYQGRQFETGTSYTVQMTLGYEVTPKAAVWAGYLGEFGGKSYVDGTYTGQKTRVDDVRVYGETFLTRTWHLNVMVATDVSATGGFQRGIYTQIRLVKAFWGRAVDH